VGPGRRRSIASRVFALQLIAVVVVSAALTLFLWLDARSSAESEASRLSLAVSETLARDPFVIHAVHADDPTTLLQPYAVEVMDNAGVDFVTIMDTAGTRYTHRNPEEIGRKFIGTIDAALRGDVLTETYTGTLGPSVRAVVPVVEDDEVIAIVSAGVKVSRVLDSVASRIPLVVGAATLLVILGTLAAMLARRYLDRVTGSMEPTELKRMVDYYESVLHSVREGLILTDAQRRVVLYNDEAADLLGLQPASRDLRPTAIGELDLPPTIAALLASGTRTAEESHLAGRRVLVVNQEPASSPTGPPSAVLGTVTTLRDRTELQQLTGELDAVRTLTDAMRSQTHEYANRLHTIVSLLELDRARDAIDFIAQEVHVSQSLADELLGKVREPALAALFLGKSSQASESGIDFKLDAAVDLPAAGLPLPDLISIVGNLIDNALDAAGAGAPPAWVKVALEQRGGHIELVVEDSGPGIEPGVAPKIFEHGFSTKGATRVGRGYGLAVVREIIERHGGSIELRPASHTTFIARWPIARDADS